MMSNKFDIKILHNNFDILRKYKNLRKSEFCKLIGIANVYRTDYSSIGAKMLKGIQDNFPKINMEWLITSHDINSEFLNVAEPTPDYKQIPSTSLPVKISDLLQKTAAILESKFVYSTALKDIIEAYYAAVTCQEDLAPANKKIDKQEERTLETKDRLPAVGES